MTSSPTLSATPFPARPRSGTGAAAAAAAARRRKKAVPGAHQPVDPGRRQRSAGGQDSRNSRNRPSRTSKPDGDSRCHPATTVPKGWWMSDILLRRCVERVRIPFPPAVHTLRYPPLDPRTARRADTVLAVLPCSRDERDRRSERSALPFRSSARMGESPNGDNGFEKPSFRRDARAPMPGMFSGVPGAIPGGKTVLRCPTKKSCSTPRITLPSGPCRDRREKEHSRSPVGTTFYTKLLSR